MKHCSVTIEKLKEIYIFIPLLRTFFGSLAGFCVLRCRIVLYFTELDKFCWTLLTHNTLHITHIQEPEVGFLPSLLSA